MSKINCVLLFWPNYINNKNIHKELKDAGIKDFFFDIYNKYIQLLSGSTSRENFINTLTKSGNKSLFYQQIGDKETPNSIHEVWETIQKDCWYKILIEEKDVVNQKKLVKIKLNVLNKNVKRLFCWWVSFSKDDMYIDVLFPIEWYKTKK